MTYSDEFNNALTLTCPWGANAGDPFTLHLDIDATFAGELYLQGQLYQTAPAPPFTIISDVAQIGRAHV